jgi:uncharacterized protein (TIGR00255 family)
MNSMTGFGRASLRDRRLDIEVEIRSVNHRFLMIKQTLPEGLGRHESKVEQAIRGKVMRGSMTVTVSTKAASESGPALPDLKLFKALAKRLREIQKSIGLKGDLEMEDLLAIPTLWSNGAAPANDGLWPKVEKLVGKALDGLVSAREREGRSIARDLKGRLDAIEGRIEQVRRRVPTVVDAYQKRLDDRIQQILAQKGLEAARLDIVREVAIHADRCDTSEELQRLGSHIGEFRKVIAAQGQVGRRLDFLLQEMGREANTIASKGNDAEISAAAVEMKADLEKLKEQVENVE